MESKFHSEQIDSQSAVGDRRAAGVTTTAVGDRRAAVVTTTAVGDRRAAGVTTTAVGDRRAAVLLAGRMTTEQTGEPELRYWKGLAK